MLQFYGFSIWFKSTVYKNVVVSENFLLSMNLTSPAIDNGLPKMKHGVGNTDRYMLTLNCMLGKNHKTLYNCNCFSVIVNVFLKGS